MVINEQLSDRMAQDVIGVVRSLSDQTKILLVAQSEDSEAVAADSVDGVLVVEAGAVLAKLDPRDYEARRDSAVARMEHARSERDRCHDGARNAACTAEPAAERKPIDRAAGVSTGTSARALSAWPTMAVRTLLKSCATPPASRPTASSFWAWRNCSSPQAIAPPWWASGIWGMSPHPCPTIEASSSFSAAVTVMTWSHSHFTGTGK